MGEYDDLTVAELKDLLREAGLPLSGRKADLVARLDDAGADAPVAEKEVAEVADDSAEDSSDEADADDDFDDDDFDDLEEDAEDAEDAEDEEEIEA